MRSISAAFTAMLAVALAVALAAVLAEAGPAHAQPQTSSKLYCWKNKAGKTECGDSVPYEYQDAAIKEMNKQGVVTRRTEALTPEERRLRDLAEENRRLEAQQKEAQRRRDKALLDTFSNEKEIELKRSRDVLLIESNIETLQGNLKNMNDRQAYARAQAAPYVKDKRPIPPTILEDIEHANAETLQTERLIAQKRLEIATTNQFYDGLKKRFIELNATAAAPSTVTPSPPKKSASQ